MKYRIVVRKEGVGDQSRTVEAPSRFAVYDMVQKEGGMVAELREDSTAFKIPAWLNISFGNGIKRVEIIRMAKNISAMLWANLSTIVHTHDGSIGKIAARPG